VQNVVLVTELTLASARDAIRLLAAFKTTCPGARVTLVANKVPANGSEITRKDFETSIEHAIDLVVPLDTKLAVKAAKLGKCLAETARGTKVSAPLNKLVNVVMSAETLDEEDAPSNTPVSKSPEKSSSLLGKLTDLGSLMPKKKVKA
jgi:pilus assembly protein CpaE